MQIFTKLSIKNWSLSIKILDTNGHPAKFTNVNLEDFLKSGSFEVIC